ncbi:MAG: BREX-2 system adenine-specific DNA-methyltransferase PglX [Planctomycetes bacterium]|nr:BREX-2 system adenine-specific DNA-methyltransferase PglX [Planctomycetota bacterium]
MIDPAELLEDLQRELRTLEEDLRERSTELPAFDQRLRAEYDAAKKAERTAASFETWREERLTQVGAAWLLSLVFARFLEDNGFVPARLAGKGRRGEEAREHHQEFIRLYPQKNDRDYLESVFAELRALPALRELYDERWNPLTLVTPSGDAAQALLRFFQRVEPSTGALIHDFEDPDAKTRFLGDLYQDLSAEARKRYALLQTPEFVEEFLLERTLTPAIETFGLRAVRMIDPACGSGHFLLGAFHRLLERYAVEEPATPVHERVLLALKAVHGVDLNPFAIAIARFRLLVAALKASGFQHLKQAPAYEFQLAVGDSLLHGRQHAGASGALWEEAEELRHHYAHENPQELQRILGASYHVVVANPPYITVKDRALNERYRGLYSSCSGKYALVIPFVERLFELCLPAEPERAIPGGYLAAIVANSFMKREFGKKLIGEYLPRWDLTHVIDTSGAYLPGHGTPTVILIARRQKFRQGAPVRTVMGIRGEPTTPDDPAQGQVWRSIYELLDRPGEQNEFVSVADSPRELFNKHPWSLGGGGASELKEILEEGDRETLGKRVESIGFASFPGADEVFMAPPGSFARVGVPHQLVRAIVIGEVVRDWVVDCHEEAFVPYSKAQEPIEFDGSSRWARHLWAYRCTLRNVVSFAGKTREAIGQDWWVWYRWVSAKYRTPLSITFAFVGTHNHFVLDRGGKVFKQSAPIIKLPSTATEEEHLGLLGVLNSSTACFWLKQSSHNKGGGGIGGGIASEAWEKFIEFTGTVLLSYPLPAGRPLASTQQMLEALDAMTSARSGACILSDVSKAEQDEENALRAAIARQEELDWECYLLYGILDEDLCYHGNEEIRLALGERAFEIVLARAMKKGTEQTTWFARHGSTPITELPTLWPADYRALVERRIRSIETNRDLALIERPEYKRRWNTEPWENRVERTLRTWLQERLETPAYWPTLVLQSCAQLADRARQDAEFVRVAELFRGTSSFDWTALIEELVKDEHVPFLPVLRYEAAGLRKRAQWEATWELQRREDRGEKVGEIPVPPKFASGDFQQASYWRQRGKLDVPRERFVSYPHLERDADSTLRLGWGGWDHLQQAQALSAAYQLAKDEDWSEARLQPILAGLLELLPWLLQWHDDPEPGYDGGWGTEYQRFVEREAQALGVSEVQLRAWKPLEGKKRGGRKKASKRPAEIMESEDDAR